MTLRRQRADRRTDVAGGSARVYLRPLAELAGGGLPLAGGPVHFHHCEVIRRTRDGTVEREVVLAADAHAHAPVEFERLSAPRPALAGLGLERPRLMGIVNVTPDSFSDGGRFLDADVAVVHGRALVAAGAELLDVGGESTRPGARPVTAEEEAGRVLPVLRGLRFAGVPLSLDSRRAAVMRQGAAAGASVLNDVSALTHDPDSAAVAAGLGLPVVLMHSRGEPDTMNRMTGYDDVVLDVYDALAARVEAAVAAGIPRERLVLDPGLGFAKTAEQSAALLAGLTLFHGLGCPLLIGASRKSFIARLTGEAPAERRLAGSLAAMLWAAGQGAQILRVHDVAESRQALDLWLRLHGVA